MKTKIPQKDNCYLYKIITVYKYVKLLGIIPLPFKKKINFYIWYYYYSIEVLNENGLILEPSQYDEFKDILEPILTKAKKLLLNQK